MLFQSSTVLFSTAFIVQSVLSLTLPSEFIKESTPVQLPFKAESSLFSLHDDEENNQENLKQAAIHARELMQYRSQGVGTLMSTFPQDHADSSLQGLPIGLQEYFAPYPNGDLLLLSLPISNIYHNIDTDPNHSATLSIKDELASIQRKSSLWSANWRRISLFGKLEPVSNTNEAKELYESFHPDATLWDGNNDDSPHESKWVRFKVEKVFYFGGFGDRGAIGWLDMEIFKNDFQHTPEAEDRSRCFHSEGQNLYCDQPDLGPEIKEVEEEFEGEGEGGECDVQFSEDEDEAEEEDEDDSEEDLENLVELWEELDQPAVITQIINNNYITHHHHHHYRTAVSPSIEPRASVSDKVIEAIEDAVIEIREEMMEMADEMMEMSDEMMEEDDEEEEFDDEIFSPDKEDRTDEESPQEQEAEEKQEEVVVEDTENDMLEKAFKSMELAEILGDLVDLTQVDEHQIESNESGGVNFEVTI